MSPSTRSCGQIHISSVVSTSMATVHIFGNSLAYGMYGREADWTTRLKHEADERRLRNEPPYVAVANHAGPGNMLVHSLESGQIKANIECHRRGRQIAIFGIAACEACVLKGETEPRRSLSDFKQDLADLKAVIGDLNKDNGDSVLTPIYLSSAPVDEEKAREYWKADIFNNARFAQYDEVVEAHALDIGASYVDLRAGFDSDSMLAEDGVHPNEVGSKLVYEKISKTVFRHLDISSPSS